MADREPGTSASARADTLLREPENKDRAVTWRGPVADSGDALEELSAVAAELVRRGHAAKLEVAPTRDGQVLAGVLLM